MSKNKPPYLPKWATAEEACSWLEGQTGEAWPLARLLESGLSPSVWLDYSPDAPKEIFGDRTEGILVRMLFGGDKNRLEIDRTGLLTMTKLPDGRLFRATPGIPFDVAQLRYSADGLAKLVHGKECFPAQSANPPQDIPSEGLREATKIMGARGGSKPKRSEGIELAIRKRLTEGRAGMGQTTEHLWNYLAKKKEEDPFRVDGYEVYLDEGDQEGKHRLRSKKPDGTSDGRGVTKSSFSGVVTRVKTSIKNADSSA